jgi:hypothetical protein
MDEEGENLAVRAFLTMYDGAYSHTIGSMQEHLELCGYPYWPDWVETTDPQTHLTKAGAQLWLRHLFGLETRDRILSPVVRAHTD